MSKEIDCVDTSEAVCPYCGTGHEIEGEDYGEECEYECSECGKEFVYDTNYEVTFYSYPMEEYLKRKIESAKRDKKLFEEQDFIKLAEQEQVRIDMYSKKLKEIEENEKGGGDGEPGDNKWYENPDMEAG